MDPEDLRALLTAEQRRQKTKRAANQEFAKIVRDLASRGYDLATLAKGWGRSVGDLKKILGEPDPYRLD